MTLSSPDYSKMTEVKKETRIEKELFQQAEGSHFGSSVMLVLLQFPAPLCPVGLGPGSEP